MAWKKDQAEILPNIKILQAQKLSEGYSPRLYMVSHSGQEFGSTQHPVFGCGVLAATFLLSVNSKLKAVRERKWQSVTSVPRQQTKDQFSAFVLICSSAWCLGNSYWHPAHTERHFRCIWHKCNLPFLWVTFTCWVWLPYKVTFKNILKGSLFSKEKKNYL